MYGLLRLSRPNFANDPFHTIGPFGRLINVKEWQTGPGREKIEHEYAILIDPAQVAFRIVAYEPRVVEYNHETDYKAYMGIKK